MRNHIAEGGLHRLLEGQRALKTKSLEEKHATELASAGPDEKKEIYERMVEETRRHNQMLNHKPSTGSLW